MKRLEGEVLDLLTDIIPGEGDRFALTGTSVDPHQFLGLEKNPRAVPVAELVLWIGYLQWHFRAYGNAPPAEPILRDFRNIRAGDALLTYDREEPDRDRRVGGVDREGRLIIQPPSSPSLHDGMRHDHQADLLMSARIASVDARAALPICAENHASGTG